MTSRELVKMAIAHQPTRRIPYRITLCDELYQKTRAIRPTADFDEFLDNDVIAINPPWWNWHGLGSDWAAASLPTTPPTCIGTGAYDLFVEKVKRLRGETDKYILLTIFGSHFEKANFARGIENFLADMGGDPEFARQLLDTIIRRNLVMFENILDVPEVDGVLLGSDWGTQRDLLMSPATWEEMIAPGEKQEYDLIHSYGKDVWVHSCGQISRLIPRLIDLGVDVLNPIQPECMDIAKLKADYGDQITFWGGISTQQKMPFGTPDEVRVEARRVRDLLANNGGYIFAPAQNLEADVSLENLLALLEVAREPRATTRPIFHRD